MKAGTIIYNGGSKYTGNWKNGKWEDSNGTYERADGAVYTGNFVNGIMSGEHFTIHWKNAGVRYNGSVANNKLHGRGTLTYADNTEISGFW